ncbi:acylneuraminate cytidylyltransferase family protein, partial [Streptococcus pneumoniae]
DKTVAYEMPKLYSYDIDDALDFEVVETLLQHHHLGESKR